MSSNYSPPIMPLGPVMLDVEGFRLSETERVRLLHPSVGGVILFSRNFQSKSQVTDLIKEIKDLRSPSLLLAVDQEGGRVQRFKSEFTLLPPAASFGELWDKDKHTAPMRTFESAYTMASELLDVGVDFSFAPVFDVTSQESEVIGNRCFHTNVKAATELLGAYIDGMHTAGMVAIAKHFPGHGGVAGDSHHCLPTDHRDFKQIEDHDLLPYLELIDEIQGIMTAHVLFDQCDDQIPTYSAFWLQTVLRQKMNFEGIIFSDDLSMQGAKEKGAKSSQQKNADSISIVESAQRAIYAGCDMVLICNDTALADELLEGLVFEPNSVLSGRLTRLSCY